MADEHDDVMGDEVEDLDGVKGEEDEVSDIDSPLMGGVGEEEDENI